MTTSTRVLPAQFEALVAPLLGLPVSRPWRGHGSAVFLDLGELHPYTDTRGRSRTRSEAVVMIEWSWRVESARTVRFGSWSGERRMTAGVRGLQGRSVQALTLSGRLPELCVALSGGLWLLSFVTTGGQPRWSVFLPDGSWLTVRRGGLVRERGYDEPPATSPNPALERTPPAGDAGSVDDAPRPQ